MSDRNKPVTKSGGLSRSKMRHIRDVVIFGTLGIAIFLSLWAIVVRTTRIGLLVPEPSQVIVFYGQSFTHDIGKYTMLGHTLVSLSRVMVGYGAGIVLGVICGIGMGVSKLFKAIFRPLFEVLRPIPTIAWIPSAILVFGTVEMT